METYCVVFPTRHHRHHGDNCLRKTRGGRLAQSSVAGTPAHGDYAMFTSQSTRCWIRLQQISHPSGKSSATDKGLVCPGDKTSGDRHAKRYPSHHECVSRRHQKGYRHCEGRISRIKKKSGSGFSLGRRSDTNRSRHIKTIWGHCTSRCKSSKAAGRAATSAH